MRNQRWPRNSKFTSWAPSIPIPHESATTITVNAAVMPNEWISPLPIGPPKSSAWR